MTIRLRRKGDQELSLIEQAASMIFQLANWVPEHHFRVVADGAYASLLRYEFPRTVVITRLRCDAAIYDLARTSDQVCVRGQMVERLLWSRRRTRPPPLVQSCSSSFATPHATSTATSSSVPAPP